MNPSTIEHEFLHALGVHHTQSRTDRDNHVRINWWNIPEEERYNFYKESKTEVSEFGLPYDFHSVMHYGPYDFSTNGKRTIETFDLSKQDIIGSAGGVSKGDIMLLKRMYNCAGKMLKIKEACKPRRCASSKLSLTYFTHWLYSSSTPPSL